MQAPCLARRQPGGSTTPAMGVQLVAYDAAVHEGAFLGALNDAISMTADCHPVSTGSQALLCVTALA